ncbi:MAG TPA: hypothetical protein DD437_05675 [Rhodobiaceae bacterium]|nr:hypothetical protein [Rhodobiaceae bacterium]|tara:strand:- start:7982 stop:8560 length:579 start_codon:yes stop_codon:yes gene_type:complete
MSIVFKILFAVLILAYPVLVYLGLSQLDVRALALILIAIAIARVAGIIGMGGNAPMRMQTIFAALILAIVAASSFIFESADALRFYPVLVNGLLFVLFAASLRSPPSMIERLARLSDPDLPPEGVAYTRKVTIVWCGFFFLNGAIALYTALRSDLEVWAFYNGFLSYCLMGALFGGEYLVRLWVKQKRVVSS